MRAELGLAGSIQAVNQLMTIIEQGHQWEVREGMRLTTGSARRGMGRIMEIGK